MPPVHCAGGKTDDAGARGPLTASAARNSWVNKLEKIDATPQGQPVLDPGRSRATEPSVWSVGGALAGLGRGLELVL